AEVKELLQENGRVSGLRAVTPGGSLEIHADLVVGADGRHSTVREQAKLPVMTIGAPIDVLWMRLLRQAGPPWVGIPGRPQRRPQAGRQIVSATDEGRAVYSGAGRIGLRADWTQVWIRDLRVVAG
ncbi:hypothetical protein B4Q13_25155, partial [Lacticaseibacillus rhamnosus]